MEEISIKNERKIDRFDKYMFIRGLNDNKVTVDLGLSVGTIGKSRGTGRDLSSRNIEKILNFYKDLSRVWLLTGEGEMLNDGNAGEPEFAQMSAQEESASQQKTIDRLLDTIDRQMALLETLAATNDRYSRVLEHMEMAKRNKDEQADSYLHRRQDVG